MASRYHLYLIDLMNADQCLQNVAVASGSADELSVKLRVFQALIDFLAELEDPLPEQIFTLFRLQDDSVILLAQIDSITALEDRVSSLKDLLANKFVPVLTNDQATFLAKNVTGASVFIPSYLSFNNKTEIEDACADEGLDYIVDINF